MEGNNYKLSYVDFLNEIKGKSVNEICELLKDNKVYVENITSTDEFLIVGEVIRRIKLCDTTDSNQYSFLKRSIIYFNALENFTNFDISSLDMGMENYNICLEMALQSNPQIKHYYNVVDDVLREEELKMIRELDKLFKKMPSIQDLDVMQRKLKNMFSDESDERLKLIEGILAYNDPTMKTIKDTMLDSTLMNEETKEQLQEVVQKTVSLLDKEINKDGADSNGDNSK